MTILERYIMRRAFMLSASALIWTIAIVWTIQVMQRINFVTDSGQSASAFIELATMMLPSIVPVIVPFALAIGVAQTLSVMNADSELAVINASGASRLSVIRPIMLLAAAASVFSFAIDNGVDPYARTRVRELVSTARADLLSTVIQEGSFRKVDEGLFVQVGKRLPGGGLGGVFVADSRQEGVDLVYYAREGSVIGEPGQSVLLMRDGEVHRKAPSGEVSVIRFTSYAFDLSQFAAASSAIFLFPKDRTIPYLLNPDPNDEAFKSQPQMFRAELHRRLTEWAYPLIFALIALAVAGDARSHREARVHPMITALALCLLVRWAGFVTGGKAQTSAAWSPAMYGVIVAGAALPIYFLLINRTMELQSERAEKVAAAWEAMRRRGSAVADRLNPFKRFSAAGRP